MRKEIGNCRVLMIDEDPVGETKHLTIDADIDRTTHCMIDERQVIGKMM